LIGAVATHHRDRDRGVGFYGPMPGERGGVFFGPAVQFPGNHPGHGNRLGNGLGTAPGSGQGVPGNSPAPASSSAATS